MFITYSFPIHAPMKSTEKNLRRLPVNTAARMEQFRPKWWQAAALAVLTAWSVLSFTGITTFIYSDF